MIFKLTLPKMVPGMTRSVSRDHHCKFCIESLEMATCLEQLGLAHVTTGPTSGGGTMNRRITVEQFLGWSGFAMSSLFILTLILLRSIPFRLNVPLLLLGRVDEIIG